MQTNSGSVTAFAPASVGNVGVGFDVLGHALDVAGDRVSLAAVPSPGLELVAIDGIVTDLPVDSASNTAMRALHAIARDFRLTDGVGVRLEKGIPLGSGMGGSAASAAAAVVAADAYWRLGLSDEQKLFYALEGEAVASGDRHADNVAPSLFGGLVLCETHQELRVTRLPVPDSVRCVLVHPHLEVQTREARGLLRREVALADHVRQTQSLAGFVAGCFRGDLEQLGRCLRDFIVEPQRRSLVKGFEAVQAGAMSAGALGASLSGSGPSVFAWCAATQAEAVRDGMSSAFREAGVDCDAWVSAVDAPGARIVKHD